MSGLAGVPIVPCRTRRGRSRQPIIIASGETTAVRRLAAPLLSMLAVLSIAAASILYLAPRAVASDHQDSPLTVARPGTDITDLYVFPANDPSKVVLAMDVFPLIPPGLGTQTFFDPGVLYQFKIGLQSDATEDLVLQFKPDTVGAESKAHDVRPGATQRRRNAHEHRDGIAHRTIPYNAATDLGHGHHGVRGAARGSVLLRPRAFHQDPAGPRFLQAAEPAAEQRALLPQGRQRLSRRLQRAVDRGRASARAASRTADSSGASTCGRPRR